MSTLSENLEKTLASYSQIELDALWDELKIYNNVGPLAIDFVEEMQNHLNLVYKYDLLKSSFNKGQFNKDYTNESEYCLAA
jgi:RNAse (barnase) inhibitor barstar